MNHKFSIGVVIAIVLQVSGFVWWTAQQAQTIDTLKSEVTELTSRMAVEEAVNMKRDIAQVRIDIDKIETKIQESLNIIMDDYVQKFNQFQAQVDDRFANVSNALDNNNKIIQKDFEKIGSWADEWDQDIDGLYLLLEDLDKKLSDRIKDHRH